MATYFTVKPPEVAERIAAAWARYRPDVAEAYLDGYTRRRLIELDAQRNKEWWNAGEPQERVAQVKS